MSITDLNAIDQFRDVFLTYWNANIGSVGLSYIPIIRWEDIEETEPNITGEHYVRVSHQNFSQPQIPFGTKNLYETTGFIKIQLYFSKATLVGEDKIKLNTIARDSFRKAPSSDVWYRNSRILNLNPEEDYYRADVIANFTYSEST